LSESEKYFKKAKQLIPGGVNSPVRAFIPYPFFTESAHGSHLIDIDGKHYIDYCLGYGPLILGHAPSQVIAAVQAQLRQGTLFGTPSPQEVELAELICKAVPSAELVRLVTTGAEATMSAIRAARGFTGRSKIIKFEGCYHGAHDYVLVKAGSGATTFGIPDSLGIPADTTKNTMVVPYNDADTLARTVKQERKDLAAVITEPVMGNIGVVPPKPDFLKIMRELTQQYDIVLIFDEVITGFRLALGGAQEYYRITPDLTTLGKVLGGGFPMAAFAGQEEIMKMIAPSGKVYQAGTYSGNPVSVAAGLATLRTIKGLGDQFYQNLDDQKKRLCDFIAEVSETASLPLQINAVASMFQIFFSEDEIYDYESAKKADKTRFMAYHKKLLDAGVFIPPSQFETCFLSKAHSEADITQTAEAIGTALADLQETA
jgi:glutamate-1-semialdehyde 2,1-aminomutase